MEAVIWLEDYLSKWDKILLLISHSQDFLNNVTTHTIHFTNRKVLNYYDGNYDLADEYGVSAERIRQIENGALKKLKALMVSAA